MRNDTIFSLLLALSLAAGCTPLEAGRTVWGSSTRVLRAERSDDAVSATFACARTECFDAVIALTRELPKEESLEPAGTPQVVMSILGADSPGPELKRRRAERMRQHPELYPDASADPAAEDAAASADGAGEDPDLADIEADPMKYFTGMTLFARDPRQEFVILMGVPGAIDTTEVGVFFSGDGDARTRIEVTSLSSFARNVASEIIFARLGEKFTAKP